MSESFNCRGCFAFIDLSVDRSHKLSDEVENLGITLVEICYYCTGINVGNSGIVCNSCKSKFIEFYMFQQQVCETDRMFKEIEGEMSIKLESDIKVETLEESNLEAEAMQEWVNAPSEDINTKEENKTNAEKANKKEKYEKNHEGFYECPQCPGLFRAHHSLLKHLDNKHLNMNENTFSCENCFEKFYTLFLLERHVRSVHCPRPIICDICQKR